MLERQKFIYECELILTAVYNEREGKGRDSMGCIGLDDMDG